MIDILKIVENTDHKMPVTWQPNDVYLIYEHKDNVYRLPTHLIDFTDNIFRHENSLGEIDDYDFDDELKAKLMECLERI
jgi:hypothetical protein